MDRNVSVMSDSKGRRLVIIHDVCFKGKRRINWKDVERYLKQYVGEFYEIVDEKDIIYIGNDLPDEYSGSEDTASKKKRAPRLSNSCTVTNPFLFQYNI